MKLLFGHDKAVSEWVGKFNRKELDGPCTAIGVIDGAGTLKGGFVFNDFTGHSVEMSLAGSGVASRGVWAAIIHYVFEQLKCSRLQIHTRRSNKIVRKQASRLGFTFEGCARRFYGKDDGLVYALTRDDLDKFKSRWRIK